MTLEERYSLLLLKNGYDENDELSEDDFVKKIKELFKWIDDTKTFKIPYHSKFTDIELKNIDESINNVTSKHYVFETLGNLVLNEYQTLYTLLNKTDFPSVLFRKIPTNGLNAHAIKYPEGYLIVIEEALDNFYQVLFGIICRSKVFQLTFFEKEICEALSHNEVVEILGKLFKSYLEEETIPEELYYNYTFTPNDGIVSVAWGYIYREFIAYIIAHELSHICLHHHTSKSFDQALKIKDLYARFSQSLELSADDLSFKVLFRQNRVLNEEGETWLSISSNEKKLNLYLFSFYSSITIYFITNSWIDKIWEYHYMLNKGVHSSIKYDKKTHPSDLLRQLKFMEWLQKTYPKIIENSQINTILKDIENDLIPYVAKLLN